MDRTLFEAIAFNKYHLLIVIGSIFVLFVVNIIQEKTDIFELLSKQKLWFRWTVYFALIFGLLFCAIIYATVANQEFIYFQF